MKFVLNLLKALWLPLRSATMSNDNQFHILPTECAVTLCIDLTTTIVCHS